MNYAVAMYFGESGWLYLDSDGYGVLNNLEAWTTTDKAEANAYAERMSLEYSHPTKVLPVTLANAR